MKNTEKYIKQQPDTVVQKIISIFGKKKCHYVCNCNCGQNVIIGGNGTGNNGTGGDDHRTITGRGEPTTSTAAELGDYYRDELTGHIYECVDLNYENVSYSINKTQISEALNAPDSSAFAIDTWPDNGYGVLINTNNEVTALYQKQNGQLFQEMEYLGVNSDNELLPAFEAGHRVLILHSNNTYYICTRTMDRGTPVYTWIDITQEALSNDEINTIVNS